MEDIAKKIVNKVVELRGYVPTENEIAFATVVLFVYLTKVKEKLDKISTWPEPSSKTGEGGPGPLFTMGLLEQYKADKEEHERQIKEISKLMGFEQK